MVTGGIAAPSGLGCERIEPRLGQAAHPGVDGQQRAGQRLRRQFVVDMCWLAVVM
jgi:hypothetical protein